MRSSRRVLSSLIEIRPPSGLFSQRGHLESALPAGAVVRTGVVTPGEQSACTRVASDRCAALGFADRPARLPQFRQSPAHRSVDAMAASGRYRPCITFRMFGGFQVGGGGGPPSRNKVTGSSITRCGCKPQRAFCSDPSRASRFSGRSAQVSHW